MAWEVVPPRYRIADDDQRGVVVVINAMMLAFVWTCFCIRLSFRYKPADWKVDDYLLGATTVLDTLLAGLIFRVVDLGLGLTESKLGGFDDLVEIGRYDYGITITYIFTLLLSKCGVIFLYLRLSPRKGHVIASWTTMGACVVWGIISLVLISVPCRPREYWSEGLEQCSGLREKWRAVAGLDIITELAIFSISIYLVAQLNMKTRSKALVVAAFSLRLPVVAASLCRLYYLESTFRYPTTDSTLLGAFYMVCVQTHLGYAVMSFTLTGMGPFLRPFDGNASHHTSSSLVSGHHHNSHTKPFSRSRSRHDDVELNDAPHHTKPLPSPDSKPPGSSSSSHDAGTFSKPTLSYSKPMMRVRAPKKTVSRSPSERLQLRPEQITHDTSVLSESSTRSTEVDERGSEVSRNSDDSQRWIITKRTDFTIEMDRASFGAPFTGTER